MIHKSKESIFIDIFLFGGTLGGTIAKFLLDDCRSKGTVQFSRLARLGFIGKILLKSLVKKKIIDENFYYSFMNSINTVAKDISKDFKSFSAYIIPFDAEKRPMPV